jgi:hypothetical protein
LPARISASGAADALGIERGGKVRSHYIPNVTAKTFRPIMDEQIAEGTRTISDDGGARARHGAPDEH